MGLSLSLKTQYFLLDDPLDDHSPIDDPDSIARIKGLSYVSDYEVIRVYLVEALYKPI